MSEHNNMAPPPYSASAAAMVSDKANSIHIHGGQRQQQSPIMNPNSTTYHLRNHVSSLPSRIRDSHTSRANRHASEDSGLLEDVLVPHVEAFLAELGNLPEAPPSATLILYPAAAMLVGSSFDSISGYGGEGQEGQARPRTPKLSGLDDMQRHGEFVQVQGVEVAVSSTKASEVGRDRKGGSGGERNLLWWRDEAMAKRLAAYIQPKPQEDPNLAPPAFFDADVARHEQQQQQQQEKAKSKKSWGLKKLMGSSSRSSSGSGRDAPQSAPPQQGRGYAVQSVDASELDTRAKMTVRVEEMTFRVENDMGLYESFNGFALVARVDFTAM